jgi:vacuolar-type H+-ATPase subunit D/Vma8
MKKVTSILSTIILIALISCGPNAKEKAAAEKIKMDSIAQATKQKMESKFALKESIETAATDIQNMEVELTETKANLEVAKDGMGKIKEWQLGRTPQEREQQIKDQSYKIDELEKYVENLKSTIQTTKQKINGLEKELAKYD